LQELPGDLIKDNKDIISAKKHSVFRMCEILHINQQLSFSSRGFTDVTWQAAQNKTYCSQFDVTVQGLQLNNKKV